jgi:hypothetical protein
LQVYDTLEFAPRTPCNIDLLLADSSTKQALDRVDNVMVELYMIFFLVDFVTMGMESHSPCHIIVGRPFLRTAWAIIDAKEWNVRF